MTIAGDLLTGPQRVLWKMYDQHGDVGFMTDDQLQDWALACRTLMSNAGSEAKPAKKAQALWRQRLAEAEGTLAQRRAEDPG
jgi:hypothetical protein